MVKTGTRSGTTKFGLPDFRGMEWGWKAVRADLTSLRQFQYPARGWACGDFDVRRSNHGPCPTAAGDGLCVALTFKGAASGGISAHTGLVVGYYPEDVLGADIDKVRVRRLYVYGLIDMDLYEAERM